jgi:hypothetical protein
LHFCISIQPGLPHVANIRDPQQKQTQFPWSQGGIGRSTSY